MKKLTLASLLGGFLALVSYLGLEPYLRPVMAFEHYALQEEFDYWKYDWLEDKLLKLQLHLEEVKMRPHTPEYRLQLEQKIERIKERMHELRTELPT